MRRSRSFAVITVAVGALLGALGALQRIGRATMGTDASEVTHWNQIAASTLGALPGPDGGAPPAFSDQHGHGAGRRLRRGQRDRAEAASTVPAQAAYGREGVDRRRCRNSGLRRARRTRLDGTRASCRSRVARDS